ncbi:MAG: hypothetical protein MJ072_03265, partial [Clostridia bacterium]|nr:hypothetical protein [Clostridia bacterium]
GSYSIFYLENSSRTYYGWFPDSNAYVSIGTHFGAYDNGDTSVITGPARFALIYDNTFGNRNVMMKGIYKPETNVGEQKYLIADLDSEEFSRAYYSGETKEVKRLFTSGYAKVSLKVYGVTTAKINLYSIAGQEFDNSGFKDQGPKIYVSAELNGLKGKEYKIPIPSRIYDEIDNREISEYSVEVLSPDNDVVSTSKESFVPNISGIYSINYTAKDSENNATVKTLKINCFETLPEIECNCDKALNEEYSLGEKIEIPICTAKSDLSLVYDKSLKVKTVIQGENGVVASFDNDSDRLFIPKSIGVFTVYYVVDSFGLGKIYTGSTFEITNDVPFIAIEQKDSYVVKGQYFAFDNAYAFYKGEKYTVTPEIISPTGKRIKAQGRLISCAEIGNYRLEYKFEKDGACAEETSVIHCYNNAGDYFITDRIESVIPSTPIPEFAKQYGKNGLFIGTNSVNSSFEFCNKVDLTQLNKDKNLFSLVPYADEKDYGMFYLQVELTDANDSSNKVILSVNPHADAVILKQYAYVNVNYDGRTLARSTELNGGIMT